MSNYQEQICFYYLSKIRNGKEYSPKVILGVMKDCFAISRLQNEIYILSEHAAFNNKPRQEMDKRKDELEKILSKYPITQNKK